MTKLNDADAIYMGADPALKVMLGATEIWTAPIVPTGDVEFVQAVTAYSYTVPDPGVSSGTTGELTGVVAGNSLLLIMHINDESETDLANIEPAITAPSGSTWELLDKDHITNDGWGYTNEMLVYRAVGVAAGTHEYTITFDNSSQYSCALIEVTGTPAIKAVGFRNWTAYTYGVPLDVTTSGNVPAGNVLVIGGAALVTEYDLNGLTGSTGYTSIGAVMTGDYHDALYQYKEVTASGSTTDAWNGARTTGSTGAFRGGFSFVVAFGPQT